jgi:hypothetical protein
MKTFIIFIILFLSSFDVLSALKLLSQRKSILYSTALFSGNSEFERTPNLKISTSSSSDAEKPDKPSEKTGEEIKERQLSENMKNKLRRELISQGADPNYSAGPILGNPILIISAIIAVLVIIGGKGYFY